MEYSQTMIQLAIALVFYLSGSDSAPAKQGKQGGGKLHTLPLPSYIGKGCNPNLNHNELNKCIIKKGQPAIEKIAQGDPQYRVPILDPFTIPSLVIDQGTKQVGMKMACTNCELRGLKNTQFVAARADLKKRHIEWDFKLPTCLFTGQYKVSGQILVLPIFGSGKANISLTGVKFTYTYDFDLEKKDNGREYVKLRNGSKLTFGADNMKIRLDNLFDGDKLLGENMNIFLNDNWQELLNEVGPAIGDALSQIFMSENMNTFLNENWRDLLVEVGPAIGEALGQIFTATLNSVASLVPFDIMFPTK